MRPLRYAGPTKVQKRDHGRQEGDHSRRIIQRGLIKSCAGSSARAPIITWRISPRKQPKATKTDNRIEVLKLLGTNQQGEKIIPWHRLAHLSEQGDGFDVMEEYTRLKDYDFRGYTARQNEKKETCTFLEAVEQWWNEIEHFATRATSSSHKNSCTPPGWR